MKMIMKMFVSGAMVLMLGVHMAAGQKIDDLRMERDIEVAENVLGTLIRQQFEQQRMFFPLDIKGYYQPGYGVTFRLPADYTTPIAFSIRGGSDNVVVWDGGDQNGFRYQVGTPSPDRDEGSRPVKAPAETRATSLDDKKRENVRAKRNQDLDSVKNAYNVKIIDAAKNFIADYGDMISQLGPNEKIVITNQGDRPKIWVGQYFDSPRRTHLSIEGVKSDVAAYKQNKLTREQFMAKVKVVNTETSDKVEPDLELLSSIFSRLYRPDLSRTYFTEDNIYYERLNDFGAVFYMQVYSSIPSDYQRFAMPTLGLENVDMATREKKVKEIYPQFEKELAENVLEYGRTLKSLKDNESLIMNVTLTKCVGCGIPSSLEVTVKSSVLKDFGAGKIDKANALGKVAIKKGANQ